MENHATNHILKEKKNERMQKSYSVIDTLELPKDIFLGLPLLSWEGNRTLSITNHRGLVYYGRDKIIIAIQSGSILICGRDLVIPKFTKDEIRICGYMEGMTFQ